MYLTAGFLPVSCPLTLPQLERICMFGNPCVGPGVKGGPVGAAAAGLLEASALHISLAGLLPPASGVGAASIKTPSVLPGVASVHTPSAAVEFGTELKSNAYDELVFQRIRGLAAVINISPHG
jgi:hypothetical protein